MNHDNERGKGIAIIWRILKQRFVGICGEEKYKL